MTREELDTMWQQALVASVRDGEKYTRYHFAALVAAAEREACAKVCLNVEGMAGDYADKYAAAIRARGQA